MLRRLGHIAAPARIDRVQRRGRQAALAAVLLFLALIVGGLVPAVKRVQAGGPWYVGTTADDNGTNTVACTTNAANTCTLRDAIAKAASGETIQFWTGLTGTITLSNGTLVLSKNVTIANTGGAVVMDGANAVTVFFVNSGVMASISGLTIQHGAGTGSNAYGAIFNNYEPIPLGVIVDHNRR